VVRHAPKSQPQYDAIVTHYVLGKTGLTKAKRSGA
jgi:hypothetical protein